MNMDDDHRPMIGGLTEEDATAIGDSHTYEYACSVCKSKTSAGDPNVTRARLSAMQSTRSWVQRMTARRRILDNSTLLRKALTVIDADFAHWKKEMGSEA